MPGRLIPTIPEPLRQSGFAGDPANYFLLTVESVLDHASEFDVIHSHLEWMSVLLARVSPVPVVSTFHGRLDLPFAEEMFSRHTAGLVAISENQAASHPQVEWAAVVHNGLTLDDAPFERRRGDALCFVGRITPEKGVVDAIEIAKLTGRRLRIAAKAGPTAKERAYFDDEFMPALESARGLVEYVGELDQEDRDRLVADSYASLMPGSWPEPFGLVAIEALACGTPVIARRVGGLSEIIRDGVDGFFGDDATQLAFLVDRVEDLDREAIRASVIDRFSAGRMTDGYEAVYRSMLGETGTGAQRLEPSADEHEDGHALRALR